MGDHESTPSEQPFRIRLRRPAMATTFDVILDGDREEQELRDLADEAYAEVQRIEGILSIHLPASELSWLDGNAVGQAVAVPPELFEVLELASAIHAETSGAFDVTTGPLIECWGFLARKGRVPSDEDLARCMERVGMQHVALDPDERRVRYLREGLSINLGGIGKGYAVDRVITLLAGRGVTCALAQMGGSTIRTLGTRPISPVGWHVGVRPGGEETARLGHVALLDAAYSTSGDHAQHFTCDGVRYGHILDPRTGRPVLGRRSACSITGSAARSDALATAFVVMNREDVLSVCEKNREAAILISEDDALTVEPIGCIIHDTQQDNRRERVGDTNEGADQ